MEEKHSDGLYLFFAVFGGYGSVSFRFIQTPALRTTERKEDEVHSDLVFLTLKKRNHQIAIGITFEKSLYR